MKLQRLCSALTVLLVLGCDSPVKVKPKISEITGTWRCSEFPRQLRQEVGQGPPNLNCTLAFRADGTFSATNLPLPDPARLWTGSGIWHLSNGPTPAPEGNWMLYVEGAFGSKQDSSNCWMSVWKTGSGLQVRYMVSGAMDWRITFDKE